MQLFRYAWPVMWHNEILQLFDRIRTHFPSGSSYAGVNLDRRRKMSDQTSDLAVHSWQRHGSLKPYIPRSSLSPPPPCAKTGRGYCVFGQFVMLLLGKQTHLMSSRVKLISNHLQTSQCCAEWCPNMKKILSLFVLIPHTLSLLAPQSFSIK